MPYDETCEVLKVDRGCSCRAERCASYSGTFVTVESGIWQKIVSVRSKPRIAMAGVRGTEEFALTDRVRVFVVQ